MRPIVVTGAGGFIGSAVVRCLVRQGVPVAGLCLRHHRPHADIPRDVNWHHGDVCASGVLDELLPGARAVVHLAGPPSVAESFHVPVEFVRSHVEGTVAVLEACRRHGVRRVVYLSSAEVYAAPCADFVAEDHPSGPRSPYGVCKLAAEQMLRVYALAGVVAVTILRAFSVYGPGQSSTSVLAEILRQAEQGEVVRLADPSAVRDFTHVDDIAHAVALASQRDGAPYRVLNLGSGRAVSIGDLARRVLNACGKAGEVQTAARSDRPPSASVTRLIADARRAADELGWRADIELEDGLRRLVRAPLAMPAP